MSFAFALQLPSIVITTVIPEGAPDPLATMFVKQVGTAQLLRPIRKPMALTPERPTQHGPICACVFNHAAQIRRGVTAFNPQCPVCHGTGEQK